jgi:uncharacterized protein YceK
LVSVDAATDAEGAGAGADANIDSDEGASTDADENANVDVRDTSAGERADTNTDVPTSVLLRTLALEMEDAARGQKYMVNVRLIDNVTEENNSSLMFNLHDV